MQTPSVHPASSRHPTADGRPPSVATDVLHEAVLAAHHPDVCPWWLSWALVNPVRKWLSDPERLLGEFVQATDRVLEIGPGPGFYTLPSARRVGPIGKLVCVDVQPRMLEALRRRLARQELQDRVETRLASAESLGIGDLAGSMHKALLIYVLHEVPNPRRTLAEIHEALRSGGELLLVEPKGHCSKDLFAAELWAAEQVGFTRADVPLWEGLSKYQAALLTRRT